VEDIRGMTKRINGGYNGLDDRVQKYEKAKQVLSTGV
jgi:predicted chitinase